MFCLWINRCGGVVISIGWVKPYQEGPAKEQEIAGVRVFTWNKEVLGLSPMCVRLL